jgi:hypothetical protein
MLVVAVAELMRVALRQDILMSAATVVQVVALTVCVVATVAVVVEPQRGVPPVPFRAARVRLSALVVLVGGMLVWLVE